jgi:hypothetical protein
VPEEEIIQNLWEAARNACDVGKNASRRLARGRLNDKNWAAFQNAIRAQEKLAVALSAVLDNRVVSELPSSLVEDAGSG